MGLRLPGQCHCSFSSLFICLPNNSNIILHRGITPLALTYNNWLENDFVSKLWLRRMSILDTRFYGRKFHRTLQKSPTIGMRWECMITQRWTQEVVIWALTYLNKWRWNVGASSIRDSQSIAWGDFWKNKAFALLLEQLPSHVSEWPRGPQLQWPFTDPGTCCSQDWVVSLGTVETLTSVPWLYNEAIFFYRKP